MSGKAVITLVFGFIGIVILSTFVELLIYCFSDNLVFFEKLGNSSFMTVNKVIKLVALPIFATGVVLYSDDIDGAERGIKKSDRNILLAAIIGYIVVRIVLLELIIPYDYNNIYSTDYFSIEFYTHVALSAVSTAALFAALYYVANYLQGLRIHLIVFYGAIIVGEVILLAYQIVLVYLFHKNFSVNSEFYKFVMLAPIFVLEIITLVAAWTEPESRKEIVDFYS